MSRAAPPGMRSERHRQLEEFRRAHPPRRVDADGARWEYLTGGAGPRTLLYLPGGTGQAEASFAYLTTMETGCRVLAVTYPQVTGMDQLLGGVLAVLEAERVTTAHVWGTSFGGMVAQMLVRRSPERVASLILANTAVPSPARARKAARQLRLLRALPEALVRPLVRAAFVRQLGGLDAGERSFWSAYLDETFMPDAKRATLALTTLGLEFYRQAFTADDLAGWPGRVLILHAAGDELYREMAGPLRQLYPSASARTFEGGHSASVAHADEYVAAVKAFLAGLA